MSIHFFNCSISQNYEQTDYYTNNTDSLKRPRNETENHENKRQRLDYSRHAYQPPQPLSPDGDSSPLSNIPTIQSLANTNFERPIAEVPAPTYLSNHPIAIQPAPSTAAVASPFGMQAEGFSAPLNHANSQTASHVSIAAALDAYIQKNSITGRIESERNSNLPILPMNKNTHIIAIKAKLTEVGRQIFSSDQVKKISAAILDSITITKVHLVDNGDRLEENRREQLFLKDHTEQYSVKLLKSHNQTLECKINFRINYDSNWNSQNNKIVYDFAIGNAIIGESVIFTGRHREGASMKSFIKAANGKGGPIYELIRQQKWFPELKTKHLSQNKAPKPMLTASLPMPIFTAPPPTSMPTTPTLPLQKTLAPAQMQPAAKANDDLMLLANLALQDPRSFPPFYRAPMPFSIISTSHGTSIHPLPGGLIDQIYTNYLPKPASYPIAPQFQNNLGNANAFFEDKGKS